MPRSKKEQFSTTVIDQRGEGKPDVRQKTYTDQKSYRRHMETIVEIDAHVVEETHTVVRIYGKEEQADFFG